MSYILYPPPPFTWRVPHLIQLSLPIFYMNPMFRKFSLFFFFKYILLIGLWLRVKIGSNYLCHLGKNMVVGWFTKIQCVKYWCFDGHIS